MVIFFMYRVILVDDDEWILRGIEHTFPWEKYNFKVEASFTDPSELFTYLETDTADVVFTDIRMMSMTGLDMIEKIRNNLGIKDILYIIISAYDDYEFMRKAINLGVVDYCRKPISAQSAETILQNLTSKLESMHKSEPDAHTVSAHEGFRGILDYINRNLDKRITLKELSKQSNYNSNYICMMFREYLGMNFSKYLLSERMKKAKELFDTGRYSVKEVQTMVGYAEYSYFHSEFTKFYGITPAKYLKD